ncbi:MAG: DUF3298 and DUF4163 domain-containing protein [Eubacterium sp.]|nr:DUF3298 and DUF4163 domain-containing protein [Eubacterium sp.]
MRRKELAKKLGIVVLTFMMAVPCAVPAAGAADTNKPDTQAQADDPSAADDSSQADDEPATEPTSSSQKTDPNEDETELTFKMKTYKKDYKTEDGKTYKQVSFEYPSATGSSQAAQAFNQFYKKLLTKWKKQIKENLDDAKSLVQEMEKSGVYYSDEVTCKITSQDDKYISVLQSGYEFTLGAHGMPYRYSYVFDAKTGKKVSAASMLGISKSQLNQKVRSLYLKKFDKTNKEENYMFYQDRNAVKETLDKMDFNNNLYYLKNGKLRFYADPYAVGPYAAGFIEVAVKL